MYCRAIASCLLMFSLAASAAAEQPNIVLINLDDAAYRQIGFAAAHFGQSTQFETPNIDSLARQGTIISSGYCSYPVCSPSRAGLLTGVHQARFGFEYNISDGQYPAGLTGEQRIIPSYLGDLGYTSAAIGKWHVGTKRGVNWPLHLGFDEFYGFLSGGRDYWEYQSNPKNAYAMRRNNAAIENTWANEGDASRYDPIEGRHMTDAFGEEAAAFITRQSQDANPFFLYLALNAPHVPLHAKQSDLDRFAHITDAKEKALAAMMYGADRAVGDVMSALVANGIDHNTVIVLTNDNGGTTPYDNDPFRGGKGQLWEGGIRVPFIIRAPGVEANAYGRPISTLDLLPTFVSLAGGDPNSIVTDGVDVLPFLRGDKSGDPHDAMHWRSAGNRFAIRMGDWKLTRPEGGTAPPRLYNLATDLRESINMADELPETASALRRELTFWEATLEKPQWHSFGEPIFNLFDHFVFQHESSPAAAWSAAGQWKQVSGAAATLNREDGYANAVLEFQTSDTGDYTATNDMVRATLETFMVNEIRFTGTHVGTGNYHATIDGNDLLFVKNLEGQSPRIRLGATAADSANSFTFNLASDLQLLEDLEITGNGTQEYEISGAIVDYFAPRGIIKTGSSSLRLSGENAYTGDTAVQSGELVISQPRLADAADVRLSSGALLELEFSGNDTVSSLVIDGIFQLSGSWGAIGNTVADFQTPLIVGDGMLNVSSGRRRGDFNGDTLVNIADYLILRKGLGDSFDQELYQEWIASFGRTISDVPGDFNGDGAVDSADYVLVRHGLGTVFDQSHLQEWIANFGKTSGALAGDFNSDGSVDMADYIAWRKGLGTIYDQSDYDDWRSNFGAISETGEQLALAVPEPATRLLAGLALVAMLLLRSRSTTVPPIP